MTDISEQELQDIVNENEGLRQEIAAEKAALSEAQIQKERSIQMDLHMQEKARLKRELEDAKAATALVIDSPSPVEVAEQAQAEPEPVVEGQSDSESPSPDASSQSSGNGPSDLPSFSGFSDQVGESGNSNSGVSDSSDGGQE